jgi:DNA-binding response OmpR family regulator
MANILIIDDDPLYANMLEQRLSRAGHDVSLHVGPFGGTVAARRPNLDLIILDVFMPGLDGGALLDLMRQSAGPRPRVILCSSMDAAPLRSLAMRHHADGSIPKGAGRQQLVEYVERILSRSNVGSPRPPKP